MDGLDLNLSNTDEGYVINLWKAFCRSRKALSFEYNATEAVINKWDNRFFKISSIEQIRKYVQENITIEGHVLDDPF
jgi:predicted transcriptional regulator